MYRNQSLPTEIKHLTMNQAEYLKERVEQQIDWYDCRSRWNKRWFISLQIVILIASAAVPVIVLMPLVLSEDLWMRIIIAVLGSLTAVLTGIISLLQFRKNWIDYRTTAESLKSEKFMFQTKTGPYTADNDYSIFVERVEALISREHKDWRQHLRIQKQAD